MRGRCCMRRAPSNRGGVNCCVACPLPACGRLMRRLSTNSCGEPLPSGVMDAATVAEHAKRVAADGYTIVENAIDLDLVDAIADDLARLERELGTVPSANSFEGTNTLRVYNLLKYG